MVGSILVMLLFRDVKLEFFFRYLIIETKQKSIFIRVSNFKYNGLKRASLPLHESTGKR